MDIPKLYPETQPLPPKSSQSLEGADIADAAAKRLRALGAEKFELAFERSSNLTVEVKEGKLDHLSQSTDQGLAIRCLKNGRMGFSYTFDLSRAAIEEAAARALEVGELMPADPLNDLGSEPGLTLPKTDTFDPAGAARPLDEKIEIARAIETKARALDARIKRVRKSSYAQGIGETWLADSGGAFLKYPSTYFSAGLLCVAEDGTSAETGYDSRSALHFDRLEHDKIAATAVETALEGLNAGECPTMECPAVFKNAVVADLVGFLAGSFSAESIDKKSSLLATATGTKLGEQLFSEKISIIDDGLLKHGIMTAPFDAEGNPARTTPLVTDGVIAGFLFDGYHARKMKGQATGSSRRGSLKGPPSIGTTNLYLKAGARDPKDFIKSITKGVYITDLLGLHTANAITGEFSVGATGILIENGALTRAVKGFAIAGNLVSLLREVEQVGSDLRFWGSTGAPSFVVSRLAVSGG